MDRCAAGRCPRGRRLVESRARVQVPLKVAELGEPVRQRDSGPGPGAFRERTTRWSPAQLSMCSDMGAAIMLLIIDG